MKKILGIEHKLNPISYSAYIAYLLAALLWLQSLSLITMTLLQSTVFNNDPSKQTGFPIEEALSSYFTALPTIKSTESSVAITVMLWITLIVVVVILAVYVAMIASSITKKLTQILYERITPYNLLITKVVGTLTAFAVIAFSALVLPAVEYILPLNLAFAGISIVAFLLQHWLAKRHKTPVKQLL